MEAVQLLGKIGTVMDNSLSLPSVTSFGVKTPKGEGEKNSPGPWFFVILIKHENTTNYSILFTFLPSKNIFSRSGTDS